jgi:hypothetical protein
MSRHRLDALLRVRAPKPRQPYNYQFVDATDGNVLYFGGFISMGAAAQGAEIFPDSAGLKGSQRLGLKFAMARRTDLKRFCCSSNELSPSGENATRLQPIGN